MSMIDPTQGQSLGRLTLVPLDSELQVDSALHGVDVARDPGVAEHWVSAGRIGLSCLLHLPYHGSSNLTLDPSTARTSSEFRRWNCNDRITDEARRSAMSH